jgi:hypothetical protein
MTESRFLTYCFSGLPIELRGRYDAVPGETANADVIVIRITETEYLESYSRSAIDCPQHYWSFYWSSHWATCVLALPKSEYSMLQCEITTNGHKRGPTVWQQRLDNTPESRAAARYIRAAFKARELQTASGLPSDGAITWAALNDGCGYRLDVIADGLGGGYLRRYTELGDCDRVYETNDFYPDIVDAVRSASKMAGVNDAEIEE